MKIYTLTFYYPNKWNDGYFPNERQELGVFDSREKAEQAQAIFEPLVPLLEEVNYDFERLCGFSINEKEVNVVQDDPDGFVHSTDLGYTSVAELRAGLEELRETRRKYAERSLEQEKSDECNAEGVELYEKGEFDKAIAKFNEALSFTPGELGIEHNLHVALTMKNMKGE